MRIGIITAGGDCPGLNAFIKKVVDKASQLGAEVIGFKNGKTGMCKSVPDTVLLTAKDFENGIDMIGGTMLGSCIRDTQKIKDAIKKGIQLPAINENGVAVAFFPFFKNAVEKMKIDVLIMSGGDSSIDIFAKCANQIDLPLIAIPKTIDNNVALTEFCLGYSSAVEISKNLIEGIRNTARSHSQWIIFQTMGGGTGELAMNTGISSGADVILVPEVKFNYLKILQKIEDDNRRGKKFGVIIVAEGVPPSNKKYKYATDELFDLLSKNNVSARITIAGHYIRGCNPNAFDYMIGSLGGAYAVELIQNRTFNKMITFGESNVGMVNLGDVISSEADKLKKDDNLTEFARALDIYIGDEFID